MSWLGTAAGGGGSADRSESTADVDAATSERQVDSRRGRRQANPAVVRGVRGRTALGGDPELGEAEEAGGSSKLKGQSSREVPGFQGVERAQAWPACGRGRRAPPRAGRAASGRLHHRLWRKTLRRFAFLDREGRPKACDSCRVTRRKVRRAEERAKVGAAPRLGWRYGKTRARWGGRLGAHLEGRRKEAAA